MARALQGKHHASSSSSVHAGPACPASAHQPSSSPRSVFSMPQVPILDPGIHVKPGYAPYDSGIKQGVFMRDLSGQPFVGQARTNAHSGITSAPRGAAALVIGGRPRACCIGVSHCCMLRCGLQVSFPRKLKNLWAAQAAMLQGKM